MNGSPANQPSLILAIDFGTQKVFVPSSGPTYNDVVKPMMSKLREKIDAWFQPLKAQVDAANQANAGTIRMGHGGTQVAFKHDIYLMRLEFKGGPVSPEDAVRQGIHSAWIQAHVRAFHPHPTADPHLEPRRSPNLAKASQAMATPCPSRPGVTKQ